MRAVRMYSSRVERQEFVDMKGKMKIVYNFIAYGFFVMDDGSKKKLVIMNSFDEIKIKTEDEARDSINRCRESFKSGEF